MNRWQRHIMLIMTGLSLTGYTAGATDVPVVATPPATLSGPKLMQTGNVPSLTEQKKTDLSAQASPAKGSVTEAPAGTAVPVTGFMDKNSGRPVILTAGNRPAALFILSSVAGSTNTAYGELAKKTYAAYRGQVNFFVVQTGRNDKVENWLKEEAFPFPIIVGKHSLYTRSTPRLVLIDPDGHVRYRLHKDLPEINVQKAFHDTITVPVPPDAVQRQKRLDDIVKEQHTRDRELRSDDSFSPLASQTLLLSLLYPKELNQSFPEPAWQDLSLASLFWYYGDTAGAENHLDQLTVHAPDSPIPYGIRSLYYLMDGNPGTGYINVLQGLEKNPCDIPLNSLAMMYEYMTGQKDKAVHHMQIVVDAHPEWKKDRTLSYIISRNYISLNQKDTGLAYYRDYLSRDKNPARGHLDYARLLTQAGAYNEALDECRTARNALPVEEKNRYCRFVGNTYQQEAWIQWKLGNTVQALSSASKSIDLLTAHNQSIPQSWYILKAAIEQSLGQHTAARADWKASRHRQNPSHPFFP